MLKDFFKKIKCYICCNSKCSINENPNNKKYIDDYINELRKNYEIRKKELKKSKSC